MSVGYIRQRGTSFEVRVSQGRGPDGRRRRFTRTVRSLEAAQALLAEVGGGPVREPDEPAPIRARWPLAPLLAATGCPTVSALETAAGLPHGIGRRWEALGLRDETADRVAISVGRHPAEVWGDAWWDQTGET